MGNGEYRSDIIANNQNEGYDYVTWSSRENEWQSNYKTIRWRKHQQVETGERKKPGLDKVDQNLK